LANSGKVIEKKKKLKQKKRREKRGWSYKPKKDTPEKRKLEIP